MFTSLDRANLGLKLNLRVNADENYDLLMKGNTGVFVKFNQCTFFTISFV